MPVNAEIHLGMCSVLANVLSPVQKVAREAEREFQLPVVYEN